MAEILTVDLGDRSYPIHIGPDLLDGIGAHCTELGLGRCGLLITDDNVGPLYAQRVCDSLRAAGFQIAVAQIPAGEPSKNLDHMARMYSAAIQNGVDRRGFVVALGGGVVGDLAGFVAASLFRGVQFVQIPTSLLAMVDSAVGGKTGVNLPEGKNLVGAFHQPGLVLADTSVLQTLPRRELIAGMAEIIKYGVIYDAELFARLEADGLKALDLDPDFIAYLVKRSCEIKAEVVRQDEREGGLRAILNYGHTLGHAVEKVTGYTRYLHGEALGIGMGFAAVLSRLEADLPLADVDRQFELMARIGLPVRDDTLDLEALCDAMRVDKKSVDSVPKFVLASQIGQVNFGLDVRPESLVQAWQLQNVS